MKGVNSDMKKILAWFLSLALVLSLAGGLAESTESAENASGENIFETLSRMDWTYTSGAGAWSTDFRLQPDGTFSGSFHDSEMGEVGEGYPYGTVYVCGFTGKMSVVEKVDEKTWKLRVDELQADEKAGVETIEDEIRYVTAEVYGLSKGDIMDLYAPGTPVTVLSEDMQMWAHVLDQVEPPVELEDWFLSSVSNDSGFVGYEVPGEAGMANPWETMTAEQLLQEAGVAFAVPEGAQNVTYSYLRSEGLAQMQFTWDDADFCARIQSADIQDGSMKDISGMYYTWEEQTPVQVGHCNGMLFRAKDEAVGEVQLCLWYDLVPGLMYSLSAVAPDLHDLDLVSVTEQVFVPAQGDA